MDNEWDPEEIEVVEVGADGHEEKEVFDQRYYNVLCFVRPTRHQEELRGYYVATHKTFSCKEMGPIIAKLGKVDMANVLFRTEVSHSEWEMNGGLDAD